MPPSATRRSSSPRTTSSVSSTRSGRGGAVDRERTRLLERAAVREHRVRQAALLAHLLEEPRAHAAAEHLVDDREREPIGVVAPEGAGAEHDVRLLQRAVDAGEPVGVGGVGATRPGPAAARPSVGWRVGDTLHDLVVVDVAGHRDHDVRRLVVVGVVRGDLVARDRADRCPALPAISRPSGCRANSAPANTSCTRSSGVSSRIRISSRITWRSDSTSSERNAGDHTMSERMSSARSRKPVGDAHVVRGDLLPGERVHVAAARLDRFRDLRRVARRRCP